MPEPKILYFYDALCGWCYGFSPVIEKLREAFKNDFDFEIVSGGLSLGKKSGPIGEVAPYIKEGAYKVVEQTCGVKFGEAFCTGPLEEGTMILNSVPPAIALSIVKVLKPELAFSFGTTLHKAIYVDGMHPEDMEWYGKYASELGFDAKEFAGKMEEPQYKEAAQKDFDLARQYGIGGFPSIIVIKENQAYRISQGYEDYGSLNQKLKQLS